MPNHKLEISRRWSDMEPSAGRDSTSTKGINLHTTKCDRIQQENRERRRGDKMRN
ncbi:hypothetical protein BDN72DRAFT_849518, partial [Pluteus cervinus]